VRCNSRPVASPPSFAVGRYIIIVKFEDDDICISILGTDRIVTRSRGVLVLVIPTTNFHDLKRARLGLALDPVNRLRQPVAGS